MDKNEIEAALKEMESALVWIGGRMTNIRVAGYNESAARNELYDVVVEAELVATRARNLREMIYKKI